MNKDYGHVATARNLEDEKRQQHMLQALQQALVDRDRSVSTTSSIPPACRPASSPPLTPRSEPPTQAKVPSIDWTRTDPREVSLDDLEQLFTSASAGDPVAKVAFDLFLEKGGSAAWRQAGDLADIAEKAVLTAVFKDSSTLSLSGLRNLQKMRAELEGDDATPLEKLAIERVVLASLYASAVDTLVAMEGPAGLKSAKRIQAQGLAERRLNAALKSLKIAREISRSAIAGPLRLFGSRPQRTGAPTQASA